MRRFAETYPLSKVCSPRANDIREAILSWDRKYIKKYRISLENYAAPTWDQEEKKLVSAYNRFAIRDGKN